MAKLKEMSDTELAQWQSGYREDTSNYILAEREWANRLASRQLAEQFGLEVKLANTNRWWSIVVACIGVIGVLAGAWLGANLDQSTGERGAGADQSGSSQASLNLGPQYKVGGHYIYQGNGEFKEAEVVNWEDLK